MPKEKKKTKKKTVKRKPKKQTTLEPTPTLWWLNPGLWLAVLLGMVFVLLVVCPMVAT